MDFAMNAVGKLRLAIEKQRSVLWCGISFLCGFFTSASSILSSVSPFGLAFVGAVGSDYTLWAGAGAVIGYLTQVSDSLSLRYLASVVLLIGLRWSLSFIPKERLDLYSPLLAGFSLAVTGVTVAFSGSASYGYGMVALESAICAASGILFSRAMRSYDGVLPTLGTAGVCTAVLLCVLMTGAAKVFDGGFPPIYAVALWGIFCAAGFGRGGQAVTLGAASGVAAALTGRGDLFGVLTVSALASQAFSPLGRLGTVAAAGFAGVLAALSADSPDVVKPFFLSAAAAGAAYMATPLSVMRSMGLAAVAFPSGASLGELLALRLSEIGDTFSDISATASEVSAVLESAKADRAQSLIDTACQKVCRKCPRRTGCWQKNFDEMTKFAGDVFYGREPTLPGNMECIRFDALSLSLLSAREEYLRQKNSCSESDELKHITAEQFSSVASVIDSIKSEFEGTACADESLNSAIAEALAACGQAPLSVGCFFTRDGRCMITAQIPPSKSARLDPVKTAESLSEKVCQRLAPAVARKLGGESYLIWKSAPPYTLDTCCMQKSADDSPFCGDSCTTFEVSDKGVLMLSDGMGVGKLAAVDSMMSVTLIERLLKAGVEFDAALAVLNAALLSRGSERLCTVDAAVIDLETLRLESRKAGAAPSFIWRQGKVHRIDSMSLPAGILGGVTAEKTTFALHEGDIIVLVSDGLTDEGDEWLASQIAAFAQGELSALCENLIDTAHKRAVSSRRDDCTVVAARVKAAG